MSDYYFPFLPHDGGPPIVVQDNGSVEEQALLALMASHPDQQRPALHYSELLSQVAQAHARDMAEQDFFAHENPDGVNANGRVINAGYDLPYAYDANNIESIAAGHGLDTAQAAWALWLESDDHRAHLLAENVFFAVQVNVGIAHVEVEGSTWLHYWVVVTAPVE